MSIDSRVVGVLHALLSHVEAALGRGPLPAGTPPGGPLHELRQRIVALDENAPQPPTPAEMSAQDLQAAAQAGDQVALEELVRRATPAPAAPATPNQAL